MQIMIDEALVVAGQISGWTSKSECVDVRVITYIHDVYMLD